ncbi:MAG: hypothetical protein ACKOXB_09185 [Flavobacteriales bacterium]
MRVLASILILLVVFLAATPMHAHKEAKKEHSCCKAKTTQKKEDKKNCCDNMCNPFVQCCSMMGFIPQEATLSFRKEFPSRVKIELYSATMLSSYKGEAWNPPKA